MRFIARQKVTESNWWLLALEAIIAMVVGIVIMVWPRMTLAVFVYLFGAFVIVDGLIAIGYAFSRRKGNWGVIVLGGLLAIILGIVTFAFPKSTGLLLLSLVAIWSVVVGLVAVTHAFSSGLSTFQKWANVIFGILALLLGAYIFVHPASGILAFTWLVGAFLVVYGLLLLLRVMFPGRVASTSSQVSEAAKSRR